MKREKKYLFILLGFLMAILYLHPVSALAEEAQKITVSYQYIDEDTGEIFKEEKRNTDKQAGKAYEATPRWEEKYGLEKKEVVQERIDGDSGTAYMFDLGHSKNVLKIEHLSENSEENVIQLYYKEYHLSDSDHTCVDVTIMDEDADVVIKKETFEVKKSDHFYYDIDFIIKDEQGISYRYDSLSTENRERVFSANENAMRNQVKLYYKKGSIKPNEAIVVVYKELDPVDTEYCKKQFIEGLTVGDDFYLDDIHVSGQDNDNDLSELRRLYECYYSYDWKLNEKIYIEKLSSNLNDNILKTYHHLYKLRPGDYAEESTKVVLEFVDADTGKAFKTDQRFTSPGAKINYTAVPNKLTASNGNVYYFDKDNKAFVRDSTTYVGIKNTIGIALLEGFNKYAKAGLTAFASYKISKYTLMNKDGGPLPDKYNENEIFVGGELSKREGNILHYHAIGEVGLAGKAIGQFNVKGDIDLNFPLWKDTVSLIARGEVSNQLAPFYMRHYHSKHFMWDNDMDKEFRTRIEGELSIARWKTRLRAGVENIKNYTYFNQQATPEQKSGSLQVLSASLNQDFKLGIFHLDNEVTWQKSSDQTVLPLPDLSLYHNFYMQFKLAKKVLSVQLGADLRYFTKYNAPAYMPAIQNFHLQPTDDQVEIGGYPIVNVYANLHLKRTRFYVMMYHVNQGMSRPNYFLSPHYPINPRVLKFGLSWNFCD